MGCPKTFFHQCICGVSVTTIIWIYFMFNQNQRWLYLWPFQTVEFLPSDSIHRQMSHREFAAGGKIVHIYHYGLLLVLSNHCSQVGCKLLYTPQCRRSTGSACCAEPSCSGIFIIFKEAAPSWVVLAMCRPLACVNMCVSECVQVSEFVSHCLHFLWINFIHVALQVCVFAQNCTSHGLHSHVISHGCILRGW